MKYLLICVAVLMLGACSSTTLITSTDPDARIYVNGEYIGTGQASYTDKKVAFSKSNVTFKKTGCSETEHSFRRDEKPDGGAIVGGILVLVPFLWVTEYKPEHNYEFDCNADGVTSLES
jgi:hypothetical protein